MDGKEDATIVGFKVLEYPEELNPFGSEEEEEAEEGDREIQRHERGQQSAKQCEQEAINPFMTDSSDGEEDGDEQEGAMVRLDNPQDRVLVAASPSRTDANSFNSTPEWWKRVDKLKATLIAIFQFNLFFARPTWPTARYDTAC